MNDVRELANKYIKQLIFELNDTGRASCASIDNAKKIMLLYMSSEELLKSKDELFDDAKLTVYPVPYSGSNSGTNQGIAIRKNRECADILIKLRKQKTIEISKFDMDQLKAVDILKKDGMILLLEFETPERKHSYYALSQRGCALFSDKDACKTLKTINTNYTIPSWDQYDYETIDDSYYLQSIHINDYMSKAGDEDYFTFTLPDCNSLVFACSLSPDKTKGYCCAPYKLLSSDEKDMIYKVINSNDVKELLLIGQTKTSIERLARHMNLSENEMSKIRYCSLEEIDG